MKLKKHKLMLEDRSKPSEKLTRKAPVVHYRGSFLSKSYKNGIPIQIIFINNKLRWNFTNSFCYNV